jgi:hypothetical protein
MAAVIKKAIKNNRTRSHPKRTRGLEETDLFMYSDIKCSKFAA